MELLVTPESIPHVPERSINVTHPPINLKIEKTNHSVMENDAGPCWSMNAIYFVQILIFYGGCCVFAIL